MAYKEYQYSRIVPIRWSKEEINNRESYKCEHGHNGITHPNCYNKKNNIQERKACLDIETGNLKADFAIMLSWSLKVSGEDAITYDHIVKEDLQSGEYDSRLMETLVENLWNYDRLLVHYGKNGYFDIPFARARYLWLLARKKYYGDRFPGYGEMYVSDTYTMSKNLLTISSHRQNVIANTIQGIDVKTPIDRDYWLDIQYGNNAQRKAAIDYIVEHNCRDVEQLDANYLLLLPFVNERKTSI